jgi:hypothetical protein
MEGAVSTSIKSPGAAIFISSAIIVYVVLLIVFDGLSFAPRLDEQHFWPNTLWLFADGWPSLDRLRTYNELNTPLPFLVTGAVEHIFHGGIRVARSINFALSFVVLILIGALGEFSSRAIRCTAGLLLCPYFVFVSVHDYTDMMPAALLAIAMAFQFNRRPWWCAVCCALAIACRQYAVAFPAAIFAYEVVAPSDGRTDQRLSSYLAPLVACATLLGWFVLFGGLAPQIAVETQSVSVTRWYPEHTLYFLSCIGLYFVVVEAILFQSWRGLRAAWWKIVLTILLIAAAFAVFPPWGNVNNPVASMGYLDRLLRMILADIPRVAVLCVFAIICCLRFRLFSLAGILVAANAILMIKAHVAWDKYALPLIAVLWLMKSAGWLEPFDEPQQADEETASG